eukprot:1191716-Prorocentrum_minimum.AAC.1
MHSTPQMCCDFVHGVPVPRGVEPSSLGHVRGSKLTLCTETRVSFEIPEKSSYDNKQTKTSACAHPRAPSAGPTEVTLGAPRWTVGASRWMVGAPRWTVGAPMWMLGAPRWTLRARAREQIQKKSKQIGQTFVRHTSMGYPRSEDLVTLIYWTGLWGVVCTLAVTGTGGGPVQTCRDIITGLIGVVFTGRHLSSLASGFRTIPETTQIVITGTDL